MSPAFVSPSGLLVISVSWPVSDFLRLADNAGKWGMRIESALAVRRIKVRVLSSTYLLAALLITPHSLDEGQFQR